MHGKYTNYLKFTAVRLQRFFLRALIKPLIKWTPMENPQPGYTIIMGCNTPLAAMAGATLSRVAQQNLKHLHKVLVIFDRPQDDHLSKIEQQIRANLPTLPLEFIYYTPKQARVLAKIGWGWCYSWLSWSIGLSRTQTQYAMLQDFDALLLSPNIIEDHYNAIRERNHQWLGIQWYGPGNGVERSDQTVITPELFLDAAFVRKTFNPIDIFNHVTTHNGHTVDFDTFLYAQATAGQRSILEIPEQDMVHPSQMICQFTYLQNKPDYIPPEMNNLPLVPYFISLAGDSTLLIETTKKLQAAEGTTITFFNRPMNLINLSPTHVHWLRVQATRLEQATTRAVRPEVTAYFDALESFVHNLHPTPEPALAST